MTVIAPMRGRGVQAALKKYQNDKELMDFIAYDYAIRQYIVTLILDFLTLNVWLLFLASI